jgi:hypothetical protein
MAPALRRLETRACSRAAMAGLPRAAPRVAAPRCQSSHAAPNSTNRQPSENQQSHVEPDRELSFRREEIRMLAEELAKGREEQLIRFAYRPAEIK